MEQVMPQNNQSSDEQQYTQEHMNDGRSMAMIKPLAIGFVGMLLALGVYALIQNIQKRNMIQAPSSFEQCTKAKGSIIQESYPATCVTKNGLSITQIISPTPSMEISIPSSPTGNSYSIPELQLAFELPAALQKQGAWLQTNLQGETGSNICFTLQEGQSGLIRKVFAGSLGSCPRKIFSINSVSNDFTAGRGGTFADMDGYHVMNGHFYMGQRDGTAEIPSSIAREIKNTHGLTYLQVTGKVWNEPIPLLGITSVGALINTNNPQFPGIVVIMDLGDGLTQSTFTEALSTFRFLPKETPSVTERFTCPQSGWVDCMPGPDPKPQCSAQAMSWYKANCPNFQGGAL